MLLYVMPLLLMLSAIVTDVITVLSVITTVVTVVLYCYYYCYSTALHNISSYCYVYDPLHFYYLFTPHNILLIV